MPEGRDLGVHDILMREVAAAEREACCKIVCYRCAAGKELLRDPRTGRWSHPAERPTLAPKLYDEKNLAFCAAWEIREKRGA